MDACMYVCMYVDVVCEVCSRSFRRECDRKRHKCIAERQKPVSEQRGAAQCLRCLKWFRSRGGLALHRCEPGSLEGCRETQTAMATVTGRDVVCGVCSHGALFTSSLAWTVHICAEPILLCS